MRYVTQATTIGFTLLMAGLLMAGLSCESTDDTSEDVLEIGVIAPFSGSNAGFGQWIVRYVDFAIKEINDAGGLLEQSLGYHAVDTKSDSAHALAAIKEIHARGISVVIGPATSSSMTEVQAYATQNKILLISPFATSPDITNFGDFVWRTILSDAFQGKVAAQYAIENNLKTAAVLSVEGSYGNGLAETFTQTLSDLGGTVVAQKSYQEMNEQTLDDFDFTPLLEDLLEKQPDVFYLIGYPLDGAKVTWQAAELLTQTYKPKFIGCDGNWGDTFLTNANATLSEGMVFPTPWADETSPNYTLFKTNSTNYLGYDDTGAAGGALVYDAVYLAAYAMAHSKSAQGMLVKNSITAVSAEGQVIGVNQWAEGMSVLSQGADMDYDGASGPLNFDANGDVTDGVFALQQIVNGAYETIDIIHMDGNSLSSSAL